MQKIIHTEGSIPLGLALGGGGIKGWAHVGVLEVLEECGLHPGAIAGSSVGAMIGAAYAAGMSVQEMRQIMENKEAQRMFRLRLDGRSLLKWTAFEEALRQVFGDARIEDLKKPFYAVCTDLETGKEVVLDKGSVVQAILASSAVPGIFPPVAIEGKLLVDGGLVNNVPVDVLRARGVQHVIASQLQRSGQVASTAEDESQTVLPADSMALRVLGRFVQGQKERSAALGVLNRSIDIILTQLETHQLEEAQPDVLIVPQVADIRPLNFTEDRLKIYRRGVEAARAQEEALRMLANRLRMRS